MVGGRIGADGIHGATFSSAALDESSPAQAVQIGDPITQKMMFDFLLEARRLGLYSAITDNGAGGLSSSVGEMAQTPGGARIDLEKAPLKYAGLAPWEIFLSEAQERMTLAVPHDHVEAFLDLAARREVEAAVLGDFTDDGFLQVTFGSKTVALLEMDFLHDGAPDLDLQAHWVPPVFEEPSTRPTDLDTSLLELMARLREEGASLRPRGQGPVGHQAVGGCSRRCSCRSHSVPGPSRVPAGFRPFRGHQPLHLRPRHLGDGIDRPRRGGASAALCRSPDRPHRRARQLLLARPGAVRDDSRR
jgi:hypothetical protein